jgi:ATP-dependent protease HslVU (ClpYQ) ATPase subunit
MTAPEVEWAKWSRVADVGARVDEMLRDLAAAGVTAEEEADGYGGRLDAHTGDGRL